MSSDFTYVSCVFKNGLYYETNWNSAKPLLTNESYLVKNSGSYMSPVFLYKKVSDKKWNLFPTYKELINFIIEHQDTVVVLYGVQRRQALAIEATLIRTKDEKRKREEIKNIQEEITEKEYIPQEFYDTNNLFVAKILYNHNLVENLNLTNSQTEQKYIFELIRSANGNVYREIFSGFIFNDTSSDDYPFSLVDIEPANINQTKISKLELFILQNEINLKKTESKKGIFRRKKRTP